MGGRPSLPSQAGRLPTGLTLSPEKLDGAVLLLNSSSPLPQGLHGERGEKGAQGEKVFPTCFSQSVQLSIDSVCVHVCVRACVRALAGEARCRGGISFPAF